MKLNMFLKHFDGLQKDYPKIFENLEILDKEKFEKNMVGLKTKI